MNEQPTTRTCTGAGEGGSARRVSRGIRRYPPPLVAVLFLALAYSTVQASAREQAPADTNAPAMSARQLETARKIKAEIMSPCCWNGTVDAHNSPIAERIAADIDRRVAAGETEAQIVDRLVGQYGERILARPRTSGFGLVFYLVPAILVVFAGIGIAAWLSKSARGAEPGAGSSPAPPSGELGANELEARFEEELRRLQES